MTLQIDLNMHSKRMLQLQVQHSQDEYVTEIFHVNITRVFRYMIFHTAILLIVRSYL